MNWTGANRKRKITEKFWPEWELHAAQSFTTLYARDAIREGFSDDKQCTADVKRCKFWTVCSTTESHSVL